MLSTYPHAKQGRDMRVGVYLLQREIAFIRRFLSDTTRTKKLIDLGCGSGGITLPLHEKGYPVMGLDVDQLALTELHEWAQDVPLIQGDCLYLPFVRNSLDCIVAIHCFDHLSRVKFLNECARVLTQGGLLIFDTLNWNSYKLLLKRLHLSVAMKSHQTSLDKYVNVFSWQEVQSALAKAGFSIRAASGYGWVPFPVNSNNRLVNTAAHVEQLLQLDRFPGVSPRVLVAVQKHA
jgi:SAM-dependent methyltransferase